MTAVRGWATLLVGAAAVAVGGTWAFRRALDARFRRHLVPPPPRPKPLPGAVRDRAIDLSIPIGDRPGDVVAAWRIDPEPGPARGVAVLVHGWGSDAGRMGLVAPELAAGGIVTIALDLPGHGRTGGRETYHAPRMVRDVNAVRDWLSREPGLATLPAAVVGASFGGLGAIVAASRDRRWDAVVTVCAPANALEATEIWFSSQVGMRAPWLKVLLRGPMRRVGGEDPDAMSSERAASLLDVPLLVVHGKTDDVVPPAHGERIARAARGPVETAWIDTGHDTIFEVAESRRAVARFVARVLGAKGGNR